jgi:predicted metalloprotease with PDZ domain
MPALDFLHYLFIFHFACEPSLGDGMEHLNSTQIIIQSNLRQGYREALETAAHEFFHVWNVKRIRPFELGPFDYTKENYTSLLWVSEGFTDYYSGQIMRRAGLITEEEYLTGVSKAIQDLQETPGRLVESAAEASFDAWIKFYRQDANSPNVAISYYLKGNLIGLVLDLEIRNRTGERSLDDVMRLLYVEYFQKQHRGFTDGEFQRACEQVAGDALQEIFENYCYGTREINFPLYLAYAGLKFAYPSGNEKGAPRSYLGISAKTADGGVRVVGVTAGSPADQQGLNLNDELIAVNGFRVNQELLTARLEETPPGTELDFLISRDGRLRSIHVALGEKQAADHRIEQVADPTPRQKQIYESWLRASWKKPGRDR